MLSFTPRYTMVTEGTPRPRNSREASTAVFPPPITTAWRTLERSIVPSFIASIHATAPCTPARSSPGIPKELSAPSPAPTNTASKSCSSEASETCSPTVTPVRTSMPPIASTQSASCNARSAFILYGATPLALSPPIVFLRSKMVQACPRRRSSCAAAKLAGPAPTNATRLPVSLPASKNFHPSANAMSVA